MGEKKRSHFVWYSAVAVTLAAGALTSRAQNLLSPNDFIIAIDRDSYPAAENPANVLDGNASTKYLNFGKVNTGFIVVPSAASIVQSFTLSTANDSAPRDPTSYQLFGTNAPVTSADNDRGNAEPWTLIQSGSLSLPDTRLTLGPTVDVVNSTSYTAYKMIFPTIKNTPTAANSMQIGDAQFYTATGAGGSPILAPGNHIVAVASDGSQSSYPATQNPPKAIDGDKTSGSKYLNFGRENSGLIITPAAGATTVRSIRLTTANDTPSRDPSAFQLFGTNDAITDVDNSPGNRENWTLIASGPINLPGDPTINTDQRNVQGDIISFANDTPYTSYRIVFTENKGPDSGTGGANSIQFSELEMFSTVPEPTALGLIGLSLLPVLGGRRGRRNA